MIGMPRCLLVLFIVLTCDIGQIAALAGEETGNKSPLSIEMFVYRSISQ